MGVGHRVQYNSENSSACGFIGFPIQRRPNSDTGYAKFNTSLLHNVCCLLINVLTCFSFKCWPSLGSPKICLACAAYASTYMAGFMLYWQCISIWTCKEKPTWCTTYSLYISSTSTCFGGYLCPSSGGTKVLYNNRYLLFFLDDCLLSCPIQPRQQTVI